MATSRSISVTVGSGIAELARSFTDSARIHGEKLQNQGPISMSPVGTRTGCVNDSSLTLDSWIVDSPYAWLFFDNRQCRCSRDLRWSADGVNTNKHP